MSRSPPDPWRVAKTKRNGRPIHYTTRNGRNRHTESKRNKSAPRRNNTKAPLMTHSGGHFDHGFSAFEWNLIVRCDFSLQTRNPVFRLERSEHKKENNSKNDGRDTLVRLSLPPPPLSFYYYYYQKPFMTCSLGPRRPAIPAHCFPLSVNIIISESIGPRKILRVVLAVAPTSVASDGRAFLSSSAEINIFRSWKKRIEYSWV